MKHWGSRVADFIGIIFICWMISWTGLSVWESVKLLFWILFVQWIINFVKEVIEY